MSTSDGEVVIDNDANQFVADAISKAQECILKYNTDHFQTITVHILLLELTCTSTLGEPMLFGEYTKHYFMVCAINAYILTQ